jgi:signal transduction histidine kinase/CheY-like chemotaxis protein
MSIALQSAKLFDETTRLLKETEQRTAELSVINSVQEGLAKELHMQGIYELVGDKLSEVMHTLDIDIRLFSPETNQVFFPYMRDHGERLDIPPGKFGGMSKHVYETRQPIVINEDLPGKMREFDSYSIPGTQMEKSFMAVPIMVSNNPVGMVSMSNYERENAFSESDLRLLQTVVSAMSVALENARLFDETTRLLKETEQRTAELGVINSVQEGLVKEMNIDAIYELVGNRLCDLFPDTQTLVIRTFDYDHELEHWQFAIEKGVRLYSDPKPINWLNKQLIDSGKPVLINEDFLETAKKHGGINVTIGQTPKSVLFVPMIVGDVVKGSVSLQNVDRENAFSDSDLRLLTTLTNSMSVALENARLFDETNHLLAQAKQRASELATVNNISKALASKLNPTDLIQLVGDQLRDLFNANIVYLALLNKKNNIIHFPYQYGDSMTPLKLGEGLTSNIILNGQPLLFNKDVEEQTGQLGLQRVGIPAASYLGVPIPVADEIVGVLSVQSTEHENRFDENDLRLLSTIASSVGVALRNAQLFEDVEQAKMEAENATKIAEKANEAKSAFLSTVSHELRTPLTSVLGFAKIINKRLNEKVFPILPKDDPKTAKTVTQVNENLQVVISEGERLTHLINDVLDLAKIEAGKMEWNQENVSLPEVVERAISATTSLFEQKNLKLIKKIDLSVPDIVGDPDKLIQVVINLFSNAVKFTDKGDVTCKVYQKNNEVIVSVKDTGIGIAPEDYAAVFEQFKQVGGDTLTDKPKGTGLGLPICKEIVEHHAGRIWVESEIGKGSTFSFAIPFVPSEGDKATTKPIHLNDLVKQLREQMVFSELKPNGSNARILVVDDDNSIRSLLEQELSEAGYLIEQATNGKEALDCIRKNRPDLIILDVMMPEMNGFDVAAILKNDPQTMDIPIIILSIVQDKARGFRIGVDRYLTKPIDTAQLFTEVGNLLEQGKSKKKVMVVDEDAAAVRSLTEVLQTKGYQVVESDGKELAAEAIATKPDIIILNSVYSGKQEIVKTLRFEKGLENVLFFIYQ